jgi:hypothetical protein
MKSLNSLSNKNFLRSLPIFLISLLFINSCDDTLDPVKENDRFFYSIFGYLDSSEERQWIRIINLQEDIDTTGQRFDGYVSLENLETGETSTLKDSLFQFSSNIYAHNFWTEQEIRRNHKYRITVERSDGSESSVTVEIPNSFEEPEYRPPVNAGDPGRLIIREADNLADASIRFKIKYSLSDIIVNQSISVISDTISSGSNSYYIPINTNRISQVTKDLETAEIIECELYVARAGSDWIYFASLDRNLIALPDGISNVDNGTGYVVGVTSITIPYPNSSCSD